MSKINVKNVLHKVKMVKVIPKRVIGKYRDGKPYEYITEFVFGKILIDKITKDTLVHIIKKKGLNFKWLNKLTLINEGKRITWKYKGKPAIYIYKDGFYVLEGTEVDNNMSNNVYRCASILSEHEFIENFQKLVE